ncbi:MAG: phosphoglycerol transferase MdoB-like AlkP superfamily enzyme [Arcobacteraceae bacterium]|jgi:phosphoglycerol transferase MdoB-like AlkP superfamily enzyme
MIIIKQLLKYYFYLILVFFVGRLFLLIAYFDRFSNDNANYLSSFLFGLRMDTIVASAVLVIPMILLTLFPTILKNFVNKFLKYYFLVMISFFMYIEIATFPFFAQYDVRPNYLFVEYLEYPKEVFGMLLADYKMALFIAFCLIGTFIYLYLKNYKDSFLEVFHELHLHRIIWFIPLLIVLFIGIRSSFGHRGANNSDAMYSSNRILNEVTKNSFYSIAYAIYSTQQHSTKNVAKRYGKMDMQEAIQRVQKRLNITNTDEKYILSRMEKSHFKTDDTKNIVIFIQESLGYQFVESVGGEAGITPELNKLSKEGILFTNLYSNGTRSIRGLAGSVAGNFSVPGKGVLKRNKSQKDFFTLGNLLKPLGYHTSFIYGGESRFDNMKSWFSGNGFSQIIDQSEFIDPTYTGTWGVSDGDVVNRANEEYKKLYKENKKFASVIFSTSNHTPFDFPENKIKLIEGVPTKSVKNAIKYADFAIGDFIKQARTEEYYKDTIFVILADHNVRVYGDDMVPVNMFQVPGLILGDSISPMVYENIATQPDVLATAIDLIGLDAKIPIMGHSIFSDEKQNVSLMQFNDSYALRVDDKIAIIRPNTKPLTFKYENKRLLPMEQNVELEQDVLAFVLVLNHMYENKLYK